MYIYDSKEPWQNLRIKIKVRGIRKFKFARKILPYSLGDRIRFLLKIERINDKRRIKAYVINEYLPGKQIQTDIRDRGIADNAQSHEQPIVSTEPILRAGVAEYRIATPDGRELTLVSAEVENTVPRNFNIALTVFLLILGALIDELGRFVFTLIAGK
jgi:hypothetical protein